MDNINQRMVSAGQIATLFILVYLTSRFLQLLSVGRFTFLHTALDGY